MPQALWAAWALLSAPSAGWPWGVELLRALWVAASSVSDDPVGAYLWWAGVVWSATAYVCLTFAVICAVGTASACWLRGPPLARQVCASAPSPTGRVRGGRVPLAR